MTEQLAARRADAATARLPDPVLRRVHALAGLPSAWSPTLSPDGSRVAFVGDRSGLPRLEVAPVDGSAPPYTCSLPDQEVVSASWSPCGRWIAYVVSPRGLIRSELHVVRPDGTAPRCLAGAQDAATVFAGGWSGDHFTFSLAGGRDGDADVVQVRVGDADDGSQDGEVETLAHGGFLALTSTDPQGRWLLARRGRRGERHVVLVDRSTGERTPVLPHGFTGEDGRFADTRAQDGVLRVLVRTPADREYTVLGGVELAGDGTPGPFEVLRARYGCDLDSYAVRPDGRSVVCVWNEGGRSVVEVCPLDGPADLAVTAVLPPDAVVSAWTLRADGLAMVLSVTAPRLPRALFHVDLPAEVDGASPEAVPLLVTGLDAEQRALLETCVVPEERVFHGLDGLRLHGWLYRPPGADDAAPGPAVVSFHGGPESQDRPAFSAIKQGLVAAGLTVFAPNVRGSSGYGSTFVGMDDGDRRIEAVDDVVATAQYLLDSGVADPARIGAHGWSYGGYLTLLACERWPDVFSSGTSVCGMSDLRTFFAGTEPWMAAASTLEYGDPDTQADLLARLSPMASVDRVRSPVLLVHGGQDTNVPVAESTQMHRALQQRGVPTELVVLPGEGHAVVGRIGRRRLVEEVARWHANWL